MKMQENAHSSARTLVQVELFMLGPAIMPAASTDKIEAVRFVDHLV